jgi:hypothetical protein
LETRYSTPFWDDKCHGIVDGPETGTLRNVEQRVRFIGRIRHPHPRRDFVTYRVIACEP